MFKRGQIDPLWIALACWTALLLVASVVVLTLVSRSMQPQSEPTEADSPDAVRPVLAASGLGAPRPKSPASQPAAATRPATQPLQTSTAEAATRPDSDRSHPAADEGMASVTSTAPAEQAQTAPSGEQTAEAATEPADAPDHLAAKFMGVGGSGRKIVYLVDASGSLIDSLPFVILELKRSINDLGAKQSFTVIFFQGEEVIEVPPPGLKTANQQNKGLVIEWMDPSKGNVTPMNLSNPVKAIQSALRYEPDVLFLLSDDITGKGRYEVDQRRLLAEIERANTGHTRINAIQFLYQDPLKLANMAGTMELIAQRSGGVFKFIDGKELGIE